MLPALIAAMAVGNVASGYMQRQAARRSAREIERAGEAQAKAFESAAAETLQAGEDDVFIARIKASNIMADAKTVQGSSGLEGGADVLFKTRVFSEMDVAKLKGNARRAAWGLIDQAEETRRAARAAARAARRSGNMALATSFLNAGTQALQTYAASKAPAAKPSSMTDSYDPNLGGYNF